MADDQKEESVDVAVAVTVAVEASPKLLINGEEFTACSDHDVAGSSPSEDEVDRKYTHSPIDSHSKKILLLQTSKCGNCSSLVYVKYMTEIRHV